MLIFLSQQLTFLAMPKTGTTAVEMALAPFADIVFSNSTKHMNAARYTNKVAPFLQETFGVRPRTLAVMRDPVDQIRSWYRYRHRDALDGAVQSTKGISFDTYVQEVISETPPERARIGRQFNFVTDRKGAILVDHIFAYEMLEFLSERLAQPVKLDRRNVSPPVAAPLTEATYKALCAARSADFELYEKVKAAGGHLERDAQGPE